MEDCKECSSFYSPEELQKLRKQPQELPQVRGPKEYAPDGSDEQKTQIQDRIFEHIGVLKEERIVRKGNISTGTWNVQQLCVEVTSQKGSYWNYFGQKHQDIITLNAEEALFLVEQGCLELYYGGTPLSVQQAFSILLPNTLSLSHYVVYAYLLRLGYVVVRHQTRSIIHMTSSNESRLDNKETKQEIEFSNDDDGDDVLKCSPVSHLWKDGNDCTPLVRPRDAKSTASILSKLQVIKTHRMDRVVKLSTNSSHNIDFDVYLPGAHFKKSDPGLPAFCISVGSFSDPPPSLSVLNNLTLQCHPVPLKFALTADGTITINSLTDVNIPVYITNG